MAYLSFFRIRFLNGLQYRLAAFSGCITQFAWGFLEILLFHAFYETGSLTQGNSFPMTINALASYVWLQQAFLALYAGWIWELELFDSIRTGNIAYELCRPINIYGAWFTRTMANRLARACLRCFPILIVAAFLPKGYGLSAPPGGIQTFWFLLSMLLSLFVVIAFQMLVYASSFFLVSSVGFRAIIQSLTEFLCGGIIPLPFLPDSMQNALSLLPFASMQNAPFRIYSGDISGNTVYITIFLQLFWFLVLVLAGNLLMNQ